MKDVYSTSIQYQYTVPVYSTSIQYRYILPVYSTSIIYQYNLPVYSTRSWRIFHRRRRSAGGLPASATTGGGAEEQGWVCGGFIFPGTVRAVALVIDQVRPGAPVAPKAVPGGKLVLPCTR